MGPDLWQPDFWRATATNMAKMRFNFWSFHTYPGKIIEPMVWVGTKDGCNTSDGAVLAAGAYESSWWQTEDFWEPGTHSQRGNLPGSESRASSEFCCGASAAFPRDCYGSDANSDAEGGAICFPQTPAQSAAVLNAAGALLKGAFTWAASTAGVDGCLGIEFPLVLPPTLALPPGSSRAEQESYRAAVLPAVYEGMFGRIKSLGLPLSRF